MPLPEAFIERMKRMLGEEAIAFFQSYEDEKTTGLRVNTLKLDPEKFRAIAPFAVEPVPFCPSGFYVHGDSAPGKHPFHQVGVYYIQEPSAMYVAEVLDPKPGEKVLDLCAAPGGKTTHIAAKMKDQGLLISNDINSKRVKALAENVERFGATNSIVLNEKPKRLADKFPSYFDRILVDAPCSGEGMFRKDPEAIKYWSLEHVKECSLWQHDILDSAYEMLCDGGTLVYSTCTFSPHENEAQIADFLDRYPDMEIIEIFKPDGILSGDPSWISTEKSEVKKTARLWPHHLKGEGHFVARLIKRGQNKPTELQLEQGNVSNHFPKDYRLFEELFLNKRFKGPMLTHNDQLFLLPDETPKLDRLRIIRAGLHLGTLKKNRFEPSHSLAMALEGEDVKHRLDLHLIGDDWKKYLRGETLSTGGNHGWTLVTIEGFPLGWGKEVQGTLKNFYPKGLRIPGM